MAMEYLITDSQESLLMQDKDKAKKTLLDKVYWSLFKEPKTMLMISRELGWERASICWKIKELRESDNVFKFKTGRCPVSGHSNVGFYLTDMTRRKDEFKQLKLF